MDDLTSWATLLAGAAAERDGQPERICALCVAELDISGAGISIMTSTGSRGVICSTDDVSAQIEDLQITLGEGPCIDSVHSGAPVLIPDLSEPDDLAVERWPEFMRGAALAGVCAVFAFPLRIGVMTVGAMDLYRDRPGDLGLGQLSAALMAADAAALAVLSLHTALVDDAGLHAAGSSLQVQVHQATGMVQVQLSVSTEEAFLALRARSFATGQSLAELASDVVERRVRFSTEDR